MEVLMAILVGILYTAGVYLLLRRSIIKLVLGIIFISNATNLLIFISSGLIQGSPAFVDNDSGRLTRDMADPLPQALILTAIVIGFGIVAFTLALKYKFYATTGTDDLDQLKNTEKE